jgi:tetratricopeptide (TPR) repeat protein
MPYAGDSNLDPKIQQRILTAFAEAVRLYRESHAEESLTILRSIADVDATFAPAQRLEAAINAGAPVDLSQLLGDMTASSAIDVETVMVKARQAFELRDFQGAIALSQSVLKDLPGHAEARRLALDAQARLRGSIEVQAHVTRARDALAGGHFEEAASFLRMARAADPANPEIAGLEKQLSESAPPPAPQKEPEFEFEVYDHAATPAAAPESPPSASGPAPEVEYGQFEIGGGDAASFDLQASPEEPIQAKSFDASFETSGWDSGPSTPAAEVSAGWEMEPMTPGGPPPVETLPPPPPAQPATRAGSGPSFGAAAAASPAGAAQVGFALDMPASEQGLEFGFDSEPSFEEPPPAAPAAPPQFGMPAAAPARPAAGGDSRIQDILDNGQAAYDRRDYQGAIEIWTRIFLIDAHHAEAETRIEQARRRHDDVEREAEQKFYEARDAFDQGRVDDSRRLCQEALRLQPQHLDAHDLLLRIETPAAPPPAPSFGGNSSAEDDLFKDDFVPAAIVSAPAALGHSDELEEAPVGPRSVPAAREAPRKKAGKLPVPMLLGGIAGLAVLLGGLFFFGGKMFSSDSNQLAGALRQADQLATEGRYQEAIEVLESMQNQVHGEQLNLLIDRAKEYRGKLVRKATPVPVIDTQVVRDAIAASQRLKASRLIEDGLSKNPTDLELTRLKNEIIAYSPAYQPMQKAINSRSWETVMRLAEQVLDQHGDDPEAKRIWASSAYNFSVELLGKYQVAQAHSLLQQLVKKQDDPEAERLDQFAKSYLSRPVDPRYKIFVDNVETRKVE